MSDTSATDAASETPETAAPDTGAPAVAVAEATAAASADAVEAPSRADRKVREGLVISNANDQTAVVRVTDRVRHRRYAKTVQRSTKLHVHDAENATNVGDRVRIVETRPLSKMKRWRLVEILERAR